MKKYSICIVLFILSSLICILTGYLITRYKRAEVYDHTTVSESEYESTVEDREVLNEKNVENKKVIEYTSSENEIKDFYLVSEAGVLIVCFRDRDNICLYTHIPLTDFPEQERVRLMDGIWFESMGEVLNYLESYTS